MSDLVSIIMPSYNTGRFIEKSIRSVLEQTYTNWELWIVDDCSTDDTDEVVRQYLVDERIHYIKNEKNSGAAISRNRALREAKGRWVAFLDSDDLWLPEKLKKQIQYMEEHNYKFTYTDYQIVLSGGQPLNYICTGPNKVTLRKLYQYCYFSTITVIYDRETVGLIQIADIKKNNDYAMWFQAAQKTDMYRYPECLSIYCRRENSISSGSKWKLIKHHYIMYRKALDKSVLVSVFFTGVNLFFGVFKKLVYKRVV